MIDNLILFIWLGVSVVLIWPLAIATIDSAVGGSRDPDGFDWTMGLLIATFGATFWPLVAAPALSWFIWNRILARSEKSDVDSDVRV